MFKKLHISIPLADTLAQMPKYVMFMKEILQNKSRLEKHEMMILNEECNAILLNKLSPKLKNPRSFTIPYAIGNSFIKKSYVIMELAVTWWLFLFLENLG